MNKKEISNKIDKFLDENPLSKDTAEYEKIQILLDKLKQIKEEFSNGVFFISVLGGVKSGKSTLINLLSHKKVSTTRTGVETTLRPLIVSKANNTDITKDTIFAYKKVGISSSKDFEITKADFDECINHIKGFGKKPNANNIEIIENDLNKDIIEDLLTNPHREDGHKIIIVHIAITENSLNKELFPNNLLSQNIAFIDTPGLDGITAGAGGQREEGNKDWLIERVDLALILQSTVSPLNNSAIEYIQGIEFSEPEYLLMHNKFYLKPWLNETKQKDLQEYIDNRSVEVTKEKLKEKLGIKDLDSYQVDFAKAEDGIDQILEENQDNIQLIHESGFEKFEENIYTLIQKNKGKIHDERIEQVLKDFIKYNLEADKSTEELTIIKIKRQLKEEEDRLYDIKIKQLHDIENLITKFDYEKEKLKIEDILKAKKEVDQKIDDGYEFSSLRKKIHKRIDKLRDNEESKETFNDKIKDLTNDINGSFKNLNNSFEQFTDYINAQMIGEESIKNILLNLDLSYSLEGYITQHKKRQVIIEDLKEKFGLGFFDRNINIGKFKIWTLTDEKKEILNKIESAVTEDLDKAKSDLSGFISNSFDDITKKLDDQKNDRETNIDENQKSEQKRITEAKKILKKLEYFLQELK